MARAVSPELIPEDLGCHSFRHTKAMHMLEADINLVYIRDFLGHVSTTTTEVSTKEIGSTFSKQDYLQYWNYSISDPTAKNDIQTMVNSSLCRKDGFGPATKYVVLAKN